MILQSKAAPKPEFSLEEFQRFAESHGGRWELSEGVPVKMESPSNEHQWISLEIAATFREYLKGRKCMVRQDIDVWTGRKPFQETARKSHASVRRPDVLIYCGKDQRRDGIILSPQLVVEIWSPTNMPRERTRKFVEYTRIGVKEFWQIDYEKQDFNIISVTDGVFQYLSGGTFRKPLESKYFPGLKVDLSEYYNEFG